MKLPLYGMIRKNRLLSLYEISSFEISNHAISTYDQIADVFIRHLKMNILATENVYALCLMNDGTPIGICEVSKGSSKDAVVPINSLAKMLLLIGADRFVLLHNHTNNSSCPSDADICITRKIMELSNFLDIDFEDHIIISRCGWNTIIHKRR